MSNKVLVIIMTLSSVKIKDDFRVSADPKPWITLTNSRSSSRKIKCNLLFWSLR